MSYAVLPTKVLFLFSVLIFAFFWDISADEIFTLNRKANRHYEKGNYEEALKLYNEALLLDPSEDKLRMNKGSALYKLEDYSSAKDLYSQALNAEDKKTLADAYYNLGNILFKQGQQFQAAGNPEAQKTYQQALESYIKTLDIRPDDKDAKWNLQLAHQRMMQVEQQQQNQQEQQDDDSGDQNEDQQNQQEQQQDDSGDQNEDQQNQQQSGSDEDQDQENNPDQSQSEQNQESGEQENEGQSMQESENEIEEGEAARLIEMFADDAEELHKPPNLQNPNTKRPEKDW